MRKRIAVFILLILAVYSHSLTFCIFNGESCGDTDTLCNDTNTVALSGFNETSECCDCEDEVNIYLCSDRYIVGGEQKLHFMNLRSISIIGKPSRAHFQCNNIHYGLHLVNISQITLSNVTFQKCGFMADGSHFRACVYIQDSRKITVSNVTIEDSRGIGMLLGNNSDSISVFDSAFHRNGRGVVIDSSTGERAAYEFKNCTFVSNNASNGLEANNCFKHSTRKGYITQGGGMAVYFRCKAYSVKMEMYECQFNNNSASQGGALYIEVQQPVRNVIIHVVQSIFGNNTASTNGGAVSASLVENEIEFVSCDFTCNHARNGGGVYVYTAPRHKLDSANSFKFDRCSWHLNTGMYGSALIFVPHTPIDDGFSTIPIIKNCNFTSNTCLPMSRFNGLYYESKYGRGTMYVSSFNVAFEEDVVFSRNADTAVYMYSSVLVIRMDTNAIFESNSGFAGAAIRLEGSSIQLNDNVFMTFDSNVAYYRGSAIYHNTLKDEFQLTSNCFINYAGLTNKSVSERNSTVIFSNNSMIKGGTKEIYESIFVSSLLPCSHSNSAGEFFNSTATFSFTEAPQKVLATYPSSISVNGKLPELIIPGRAKFLDITAYDNFNRSVANPVYIIGTEGNITIDSDYTIMKNSTIRLLGTPGSRGNVSVRLYVQDDKRILFPVALSECPPGYAFSVTDHKCLCSAKSNYTVYLGIKRCKNHNATLVHGYWAGYANGTSEEKLFRTSHCPLGYCTNGHKGAEIFLPEKADLLNKHICAENRAGVICGECRKNMSVYFHSLGTLRCGSEKSCHLWLILSELLPIALFFLAIIMFDVQLTTGALNGFLLYIQLFITLDISANNFIEFPNRVANSMKDVLHILAYVFNLNFFKSKHSSFCLFKGANALQILIVNYAVVMYSLFLVMLVVILFNLNCKRFSRISQKFKKKRSVVHAFSGFLVLCYARTTLVTLSILMPGRLYGNEENSGGERVVFYQGNMAYFGPEHRKYAIPAVFALIFMTCLPPMFLLAYPSCYKVLALLHLEESRTTKVFCRIIPLDKFKPLFDSFQGEFKDEHRYFAGLYFVYRFFALAIFSLTNTLAEFYFFLELLLIVMSALHGWFQPYKKRWHNRLDMFIFTLLIVINRMTLMSYQQSLDLYKYTQFIEALTTVQVILAYTPIVYVTLYTLAKVWRHLPRNLLRRKEDETVLDLSLSYLDRNRDDRDAACRYRKCD